MPFKFLNIIPQPIGYYILWLSGRAPICIAVDLLLEFLTKIAPSFYTSEAILFVRYFVFQS
jgi:hypothetical protein